MSLPAALCDTPAIAAESTLRSGRRSWSFRATLHRRPTPRHKPAWIGAWIAPLRCQQRWLYTNLTFLLSGSLEAALITAVKRLICCLQLQALTSKPRTRSGIYQLPGACAQAGFHWRAAASAVPRENGLTKQHTDSVPRAHCSGWYTEVPKATEVKESRSSGGIRAWHQVSQLSCFTITNLHSENNYCTYVTAMPQTFSFYEVDREHQCRGRDPQS